MRRVLCKKFVFTLCSLSFLCCTSSVFCFSKRLKVAPENFEQSFQPQESATFFSSWKAMPLDCLYVIFTFLNDDIDFLTEARRISKDVKELIDQRLLVVLRINVDNLDDFWEEVVPGRSCRKKSLNEVIFGSMKKLSNKIGISKPRSKRMCSKALSEASNSYPEKKVVLLIDLSKNRKKICSFRGNEPVFNRYADDEREAYSCDWLDTCENNIKESCYFKKLATINVFWIKCNLDDVGYEKTDRGPRFKKNANFFYNKIVFFLVAGIFEKTTETLKRLSLDGLSKKFGTNENFEGFLAPSIFCRTNLFRGIERLDLGFSDKTCFDEKFLADQDKGDYCPLSMFSKLENLKEVFVSPKNITLDAVASFLVFLIKEDSVKKVYLPKVIRVEGDKVKFLKLQDSDSSIYPVIYQVICVLNVIKKFLKKKAKIVWSGVDPNNYVEDKNIASFMDLEKKMLLFSYKGEADLNPLIFSNVTVHLYFLGVETPQ